MGQSKRGQYYQSTRPCSQSRELPNSSLHLHFGREHHLGRQGSPFGLLSIVGGIGLLRLDARLGIGGLGDVLGLGALGLLSFGCEGRISSMNRGDESVE